jgi:hypothetical protein
LIVRHNNPLNTYILRSVLYSVNNRSGSFSTGTNPAASVARIERSEIREQPHRTTPHFASLNAGYELHLLHAEFYGFDRIRRIHRIVLCFVGTNQCRQHVETIALPRAGLRAPKTLNLAESFLLVCVGANWFQLTFHVALSDCRASTPPKFKVYRSGRS